MKTKPMRNNIKVIGSTDALGLVHRVHTVHNGLLSLSLPDMGGSIDESLIGLLITVAGRLTNKWSFTIHRRVPRTKDLRVPCQPRP